MPDRPRVLLTLADVAHPADAGKRLRAAGVVTALAQHCDVDVVVLFADADPQVSPLPPGVHGTWRVVPPRLLPGQVAAWRALRRRWPWQIAVQDWTAARAAVSAQRYDLVWFGALDHAVGLRDVVTAERTVVDCDDVETVKWTQLLALGQLGLRDRVQRRVELPLWGRIQKTVVETADAVLVCSDLDSDRLGEQAGAGPVVVLPNTYPEPLDAQAPQPVGDCRVVVVANFGTDQNVDAATWTADEVLPLLLARRPGADVRLVGRRPDRVTGLSRPGLTIVGPVASVAGELAAAHVALVPIRFGGGTRLKVLEAFAHGVPVVSTTAGAEGLAVEPGVELLVADTPAGVVDALLRVLEDAALAARLVRHGRSRYEGNYRPDAVHAVVDGLLDRLLRPVRAEHPGRGRGV